MLKPRLGMLHAVSRVGSAEKPILEVAYFSWLTWLDWCWNSWVRGVSGVLGVWSLVPKASATWKRTESETFFWRPGDYGSPIEPFWGLDCNATGVWNLRSCCFFRAGLFFRYILIHWNSWKSWAINLESFLEQNQRVEPWKSSASHSRVKKLRAHPDGPFTSMILLSKTSIANSLSEDKPKWIIGINPLMTKSLLMTTHVLS